MNFPNHLPARGFGLDKGGHQVIVSQSEENPESGSSQEEGQHCTDLSLSCGLCFEDTIQTVKIVGSSQNPPVILQYHFWLRKPALDTISLVLVLVSLKYLGPANGKLR